MVAARARQYRERVRGEAVTEAIREWYASAPKEWRDCWCGYDDEGPIYAHEDRHGVPLELIVCARCSTVRVSDYLSNDAIDDFYATKYRALFDGEGPDAIYDRQLNQGRALRVLLGIGDVETVIDFGSGAGGLLDAFPDSRTIGVEPGEYAHHGVNRHGSKATIIPSASFGWLAGCADYVFAIHTLEHRVDLGFAFHQHAALLKPTGRLVVEIPSLANFAKDYGTLSRYLQVPHYWQFTASTLIDAARHSGLTPTRIGKPEGLVEFGLSSELGSESEELLKSGGATKRAR